MTGFSGNNYMSKRKADEKTSSYQQSMKIKEDEVKYLYCQVKISQLCTQCQSSNRDKCPVTEYMNTAFHWHSKKANNTQMCWKSQ